jgi:predicted ATP-grasp superfamily ATP-dependent carboligase
LYTSTDYKIIPICVEDFITYNHIENNVFKNDYNNIEILNNKSKFGKYLLEYYPQNVPPIYYYNFGSETYINNNLPSNQKLILKPNVAFAAQGIRIIYGFIPNIKEHIIQKYIDHTEYLVGHFLVLNGIIYEKVYFISQHKYNNGIKVGKIINYTVRHTINIDDSIFSKIFKNLNYSGFADADFIIHNDNIIIFEINPRPGGSLIFNSHYLNIFFEKLIEL